MASVIRPSQCDSAHLSKTAHGRRAFFSRHPGVTYESWVRIVAAPHCLLAYFPARSMLELTYPRYFTLRELSLVPFIARDVEMPRMASQRGPRAKPHSRQAYSPSLVTQHACRPSLVPRTCVSTEILAERHWVTSAYGPCIGFWKPATLGSWLR